MRKDDIVANQYGFNEILKVSRKFSLSPVLSNADPS